MGMTESSGEVEGRAEVVEVGRMGKRENEMAPRVKRTPRQLQYCSGDSSRIRIWIPRQLSSQQRRLAYL